MMAHSAVVSIRVATSSTSKSNQQHQSISSRSPCPISISFSTPPRFPRLHCRRFKPAFCAAIDDGWSPSTSGGDNDNNNRGGGDGNHGDGSGAGGYRDEALQVLAEAERSLDSLPADVAAAIRAGGVRGSAVLSFLELEGHEMSRWLLEFVGCRERVLADELLILKLGTECGVGFFTKPAPECDSREENFSEEPNVAFADMVMIAFEDYMLVHLPAPTVPLRAPLGGDAGSVAKFLRTCPTNAFQVARVGAPYSLLQRIGSMVVRTSMANALFDIRKAIGKPVADGIEKAPILSTSNAYGFDMVIFGNIRYQVLAGVEQWIIEPLLRGDPLTLCAAILVIRAGNAYSRSLMRPKAHNKGKASGNALVQPTTAAIVGTRDADIVPHSNSLAGMDLNCDLKEKKLAFSIIGHASFYSDMLRQRLNPPSAST